jgi:hypothetical protein
VPAALVFAPAVPVDWFCWLLAELVSGLVLLGVETLDDGLVALDWLPMLDVLLGLVVLDWLPMLEVLLDGLLDVWEFV